MSLPGSGLISASCSAYRNTNGTPMPGVSAGIEKREGNRDIEGNSQLSVRLGLRVEFSAPQAQRQNKCKANRRGESTHGVLDENRGGALSPLLASGKAFRPSGAYPPRMTGEGRRIRTTLRIQIPRCTLLSQCHRSA